MAALFIISLRATLVLRFFDSLPKSFDWPPRQDDKHPWLFHLGIPRMGCPVHENKPCRLIHSSLVLLSSVFRPSYSASLWSSRLLTIVSCSWTVEPSRPQYSSGISSSSTLPFSNCKSNPEILIYIPHLKVIFHVECVNQTSQTWK